MSDSTGIDWEVILQVAVPNLVSLYGLLLVPAAIAVWRSPQWRFWLGIASAAVLPVLVFMNLYVAHDYYLVAVSPAVAALVGLGAGKLWSVVRPRWLVAALPLVAVALAWSTVELKADYWSRIDGARTTRSSCRSHARSHSHTAAGDLVAVVGLDWSPAVLYYAHRRGHMVTEHADGRRLRPDPPGRLPPSGRERSSARRPLVPEPLAVGRRDCAAPVRPRGHAGRASHARRSWPPTPTPGWPRGSSRRPTLRQAPEEILCGRGTRLAAGRRGTWLRLGAAPPEARLFVGDRAPLPVRRAVFVAPAASPEGSVVVTCTGAPALTLEGVADAPGPS